jgi:hypothetical protein
MYITQLFSRFVPPFHIIVCHCSIYGVFHTTDKTAAIIWLNLCADKIRVSSVMCSFWIQNLHRDLYSALSVTALLVQRVPVSNIHFPVYTGQKFWGTIRQLPCTRRDYVCGPQILHQKKVPIHFPIYIGPHYWGTCNSFPHAQESHLWSMNFQTENSFILTCIHYFLSLSCSWHKLLHSHLISKQPIRHNSKRRTSTITSVTVMVIMIKVVVELCIKQINSALCAMLVVFFAVVYDILLCISIIYTLRLLPACQWSSINS